MKMVNFIEKKIYFNLSTAKPHILKEVDAALSELLQHEIDHLDGVLSIDRALSTKDIISREVYENNIEMFHSQVDYFIQPTIADK